MSQSGFISNRSSSAENCSRSLSDATAPDGEETLDSRLMIPCSLFGIAFVLPYFGFLLVTDGQTSRVSSNAFVDPGKPVVGLLRGPLREHLVADLSRHTRGMIHLAVQTSRQLRARRPQIAHLIIGLESALEVASRLLQLVCQAHGVFDSHAGSLREVLQHGVRRVPEQRHPPARPALYRLPVAEHPHAPGLDFREHGPDLFAGAGEPLVEFSGVAEAVPALLVALAVEDRDQVGEFPAANGINNQMRLLSRPKR